MNTHDKSKLVKAEVSKLYDRIEKARSYLSKIKSLNLCSDDDELRVQENIHKIELFLSSIRAEKSLDAKLLLLRFRPDLDLRLPALVTNGDKNFDPLKKTHLGRYIEMRTSTLKTARSHNSKKIRSLSKLKNPDQDEIVRLKDQNEQILALLEALKVPQSNMQKLLLLGMTVYII